MCKARGEIGPYDLLQQAAFRIQETHEPGITTVPCGQGMQAYQPSELTDPHPKTLWHDHHDSVVPCYKQYLCLAMLTHLARHCPPSHNLGRPPVVTLHLRPDDLAWSESAVVGVLNTWGPALLGITLRRNTAQPLVMMCDHALWPASMLGMFFGCCDLQCKALIACVEHVHVRVRA